MAVICSGLEVIKAKCNVKITEYNSKISQINQGLEPPTAHPIGFQYTPVEEEDEEFFYEGDDWGEDIEYDWVDYEEDEPQK